MSQVHLALIASTGLTQPDCQIGNGMEKEHFLLEGLRLHSCRGMEWIVSIRRSYNVQNRFVAHNIFRMVRIRSRNEGHWKDGGDQEGAINH